MAREGFRRGREMIQRQEMEMRNLRERQMREKDELEERHNEEKIGMELEDEKQNKAILNLKKTVEALINEMENLDLDTGAKTVACAKSVTGDGVEEARGHLECPVCLELMRPPTRIWQCPQSHLVCETCRDRLENLKCPSCRTAKVSMRARVAENMARALLGNQ